MKFLAFDTSTEACTVAMWLDGQLLERFERRSQHSEHLLAMIDGLLAEAAMPLNRLDAIVFGRGPGSFTGLRIGAGVAQGLAFAADLPVVPVSSLAALAQGVDAPRVLVALDARMQQVYWGAYERNSAGLMQAVMAESVASPAAVALPEGSGWIGAGPGWDVHAGPLTQRTAQILHEYRTEVLPRGRHVAELGAAALVAGGARPAEQAIPQYLRDEVAVKTADRQP